MNYYSLILLFAVAFEFGRADLFSTIDNDAHFGRLDSYMKRRIEQNKTVEIQWQELVAANMPFQLYKKEVTARMVLKQLANLVQCDKKSAQFLNDLVKATIYSKKSGSRVNGIVRHFGHKIAIQCGPLLGEIFREKFPKDGMFSGLNPIETIIADENRKQSFVVLGESALEIDELVYLMRKLYKEYTGAELYRKKNRGKCGIGYWRFYSFFHLRVVTECHFYEGRTSDIIGPIVYLATHPDTDRTKINLDFFKKLEYKNEIVNELLKDSVCHSILANSFPLRSIYEKLPKCETNK